MTKLYTLDAENKKIGRVATQAAVYLMGKNEPLFARNNIPDVRVEIKNAGKASVDEKKKEQKTYSRYSGYPGGLRQPTMQEVIDKKGYKELFKEAVSGMLPKNKLRQKMMNNLIVTE
ncbi:MAG TPA: 50S ribosomal protein L13 [Candidatus Paceibacterota bacterium]